MCGYTSIILLWLFCYAFSSANYLFLNPCYRMDKDQVVLETAVRLRARRIQKATNIEADTRSKQVALARYRCDTDCYTEIRLLNQ